MADLSADLFGPTAPAAASGQDLSADLFGTKSSSGEPVGKDQGRAAALGYGAASNVLPGLTGLAGGAAAASAASPIATAALAIPGIGPYAAMGVELAAFGGGAIAGSEAVAKVQARLWSVMDPEGYANAQKTMQAHEGYATAGGIIGGSAGLSPKIAVDTTAKWINTAMKARAASAATQAGVSAGTQYATTGKVDPTEVAIAAATGAALPGVNRVGKPFQKTGEVVGGAIAKPFTKTEPTKATPTDIPKPPEGATPEEKANYLSELKRRNAALDAKAPIKQAAIKNKETGEVELHGPKHDEARKAETVDTHEQGFVDERGNFLTRKEAWERGKNVGQIPKEQVPDNIKEGAHTGDFRKAGVKEFEITEEQPAGKPVINIPDEVAGVPVTRDLDKTRPDGSRVGATSHRNKETGAVESIALDVDHLIKQFDDKPWTVSKVEGVEPLPEDAFKSPQEWIDFVIQHEAEHVKTPKAEGQDRGAYEDQTNKAALKSLAEKKAAEAPAAVEPVTTPEESKKILEDTSPAVAKAVEQVDVRTIPNKESFLEHATDIYHRYGEETATKFFEDYRTSVNERSIPVPKDQQGLDDALHMVNAWHDADTSEHVIGYKQTALDAQGERPTRLHPIERKAWDKAAKAAVERMEKLREAAFFIRENGGKVEGKLGEILDKIDSENLALVRKAKAMGLDVGQEFTTGQSRIRIQGGVTRNFKNMVKELFANKMPFGEKVADQANAAHERKVFQLNDGRVVEIHRQPEDKQVKYLDLKTKEQKTREINKGTEIWEWRSGKKVNIGHSPDTEFKVGDKVTLHDKSEATMVDGKVEAIEKESPYRYLHDAEASARLANMGLRKMVRDAELIENLKKSDLFKKVAHAPTEDLKNLPAGWKVPESIDKIPQLRGYHFDPKTAAIIEDFAKVWDNTLWTALSNQLVKNMMLNPLPHMFNEVMHLYNARGFTGWVNPKSLGRFASTGIEAFKDVMDQSQFYRDIMREGGSILGATPRNHYFDQLVIDSGKKMVADKEIGSRMGMLAKQLGTSVGDLYNGISRKSQQAMWVSRDVMYVQYIKEIMKLHPEMDLKAAIAKGERHMPNYRMPSEVLGSRELAKVLKNPNVSMFSKYHYGMVKSLVNTLKDIDPRNLRSPEGRKDFREGVDSMLAIGFAMAVLYPLMDKMAEAVFGEGAEQRRAGPYHLIQAGVDVASHKKDMSALLWPVFTFNPVLLTLGQLMVNKRIFSGKEIYHPQDSLSDKLKDVGSYAVKQIPQAPGLMGASSEGGAAQMLAKNLDIKVKTPAQKAAERTARVREAATTKSRNTKRAKGTYNP